MTALGTHRLSHGVALLACLMVVACAVRMPGRSYEGRAPSLSAEEADIRDRVETVGFYSDESGSQQYPPLVASLYPDRGNFIGFVGNIDSRGLVEQVVDAFRRDATLPSEGAALPASMRGVSWSDHRSFWEVGVPALMVTDTAPFRDPHYHLASDTPERLDYERMSRLVIGLTNVIAALAGA